MYWLIIGGAVWIGSDVISLFRKRKDVRSIKIPNENKDAVTSFFIDQDRVIYSNNYNGLNILEKDGQLINLSAENSQLGKNKFVRIEKLGPELIGVNHLGGFQLWDGGDKFSKVIKSSGSNRSICFQTGYYWVGGVSKILRIDPGTLEVKQYPFRSYNKAQNIYINGLVPKSEYELYVGSNLLPLYVFNIKSEEFEEVESEGIEFLPPFNSSHLSIDGRDVLAIASENGLYTYDGEDYRLHVPRKYFNAVEWSDDSLIMASTKDAIYKVNIRTNEVAILNQENGLLNSQLSLRSVFKYGGEICFGGDNGLDCVTKETPQDSLPTLLNIESILVDNKEEISIENSWEKILLPQNTRHVSIKLNQIYTKKQGSARILYKNSDEEEWQELPNNRLILDNPRPGDHRFEFKSDIPNYVGEEARVGIAFEIPVLWYKKPWFWLLSCIAVMVGIGWLVVRQQNNRKEKQLEEVQLRADIADLRLKALSGQMNPHFTFNALNSIMQMINEKDSDSAAIYVRKFSSMLRFVLEYSDQSWVSLEKEIKFLEDYLQLEKMRFNDSFEYKIELEHPARLSTTFIPPFFLQPKIENALKHGIRGLDKGGKIDIKINVEDETFTVRIIDNGIGREAARKKLQFQISNTNKGIKLTEKRIEQLNKMGYKAELEIFDLIENGVPGGTEIKLHLPINKVEKER